MAHDFLQGVGNHRLEGERGPQPPWSRWPTGRYPGYLVEYRRYLAFLDNERQEKSGPSQLGGQQRQEPGQTDSQGGVDICGPRSTDNPGPRSRMYAADAMGIDGQHP